MHAKSIRQLNLIKFVERKKEKIKSDSNIKAQNDTSYFKYLWAGDKKVCE